MTGRLRVLCLVPYPTLVASSRLRVEQYAPALAALGIDLEVSRYFDDRGYDELQQPGNILPKIAAMVRGLVRRGGDVLRAKRYDVALIHREAVPVGPPFIERLLRARGIPYVYDFDDAIFMSPPYSVIRGWSRLRYSGRVAGIARGAAAVVVGNEFLAAVARGWNRRVIVIPTPVDTERFRPRAGPRPDGPFVLGWVGSPTTAPYLRLLDAPLAELSERHDIVLRCVGGTYTHPTARVEVWPYSLDHEPDDVATFDVGLLPEPDDPWARGKAAFKAILYMATGVPVVASRVGANPAVAPDGEVGFCVGDEGWVAAIDQLIGDAALRDRFAKAGVARAQRRYSIDALAPALAEVLRAATRTNE